MKLTTNKKSRSRLQQEKDHAMNLFLLKLTIVAVTTAIIVYFMPRTEGFNYSYELGQPWRYGTVISTQKFNIQMSDSAVSIRRDSLARNFIPYFNRRTDIEAGVRRGVQALEGDQGVKAYVLQMLDSIYRRGVMTGAARDSLVDAGTTFVRVITGNEAQLVPFPHHVDTRCIPIHNAWKQEVCPVGDKSPEPQHGAEG